jgi:hypothetical protein
LQAQFVSQHDLFWWQGFWCFGAARKAFARYGLMQVCPISAGLVARDDRLAAQWPGGERAEAVLSGNEAIGR